MKLKTILVSAVLALTLFSAPASAKMELSYASGLTETQKAEILLAAEKLAEKNKAVKVPTSAKEIQEWVAVGTAVGQGLAATAATLGVEVNKFADTTVGMLTMGMIIWNYIGGDIMQAFFGIVWLMVMIPMWFYMYRRAFVIKSITYNQKGEGPRKFIEYFGQHEGHSSEMRGWYIVVLFIIASVGMLPLVTVG